MSSKLESVQKTIRLEERDGGQLRRATGRRFQLRRGEPGLLCFTTSAHSGLDGYRDDRIALVQSAGGYACLELRFTSPYPRHRCFRGTLSPEYFKGYAYAYTISQLYRLLFQLTLFRFFVRMWR
jgi:hypothetical protein